MSSEPRRNETCPCGSGLKYKKCCQGKASWTDNSLLTGAGIALLILLGVVLASLAFNDLGDGTSQDCPPGQVWSAEHGHCH